MLPTKRSFLEMALDQPAASRVATVMLAVDAKALPEAFAAAAIDGAVLINVSYLHRPPVYVADDGVHSSLSREGASYDVTLPWEAIWSIREGSTGTSVAFPIGNDSPAAPTRPLPKERHLRLVVTEEATDIDDNNDPDGRPA